MIKKQLHAYNLSEISIRNDIHTYFSVNELYYASFLIQFAGLACLTFDESIFLQVFEIFYTRHKDNNKKI